MNNALKTFSHEQIARWLHHGSDLAGTGLTVFDDRGNILFENNQCLHMDACPYRTLPMAGEAFDGEDMILTRTGKWIKAVRKILPDNTFLCTCINLTDVKQAQFKALENEKQFRLLAENTLDVIWLMDMDLNFIYVNPAITQMLGFAPEEWIGTHIADHCTPDEWKKIQETVARSLERVDKKPSVMFETELLNKNQTSVPVEILAKFVFDDNHRVAGFQGTTRDIRERREAASVRKELEMLLVQTQKFEALGTLAGGIAHDFNNILSAVIGFAEIAMEDAPESTTLHHCIRQIQEAGNRARDLVLQILTFSRQTDVKMQPVRVGRIAKEALKLLNASLPKTIRIETDISQDTHVLADPVQVHQILMNLCTNAAHAMREHGGTLSIAIRTCQVPGDADTDGQNTVHRDLSPGKYVMMRISDTGSGMSDALVTKIFEPYFTTKPVGEGTGIGLSVVKSIITKLNGSITVESKMGQGSAFTVHLPETSEQPDAQPFSTDLLVGGNERILFVDDEPAITGLTEQILHRMGYRVKAFENSREAVAQFTENPDAFDLIISDVTMPGTTGDDLARYVLTIKPEMPIILCTGFSDRLSPETAKEIGIKAFLKKPVGRTEFLRTVRGVLDGESFIFK